MAVRIPEMGGHASIHPDFIQVVLNATERELSGLDVPQAWDWRNVNGSNLLTTTKQQHIPNYCGSCWDFSSLSSLADRVKIQRNGAFPDFELSQQAVLNCGGLFVGSCNGGLAFSVFHWAKSHIIPVDTCQLYEAEKHKCTAINTCRQCWPKKEGGCSAITDFPGVKVSKYGLVIGEKRMMEEIYENGPIVCGINSAPLVGPSLPGIVRYKKHSFMDHWVSVVGWGVSDEGVKYWIVRNSWGQAWNPDMSGFFMVERGKDTLGIESFCTWAIPYVTRSVQE